jgi:hypothetical protein
VGLGVVVEEAVLEGRRVGGCGWHFGTSRLFCGEGSGGG